MNKDAILEVQFPYGMPPSYARNYFRGLLVPIKEEKLQRDIVTGPSFTIAVSAEFAEMYTEDITTRYPRAQVKLLRKEEL